MEDKKSISFSQKLALIYAMTLVLVAGLVLYFQRDNWGNAIEFTSYSFGVVALFLIFFYAFSWIKSSFFEGIFLIFIVASAVLITDKALLIWYPRSNWIPDTINHYRNRPNNTFNMNGAVTTINSYGFKDDEFPVSKPEKEFRILVLGDSITMGDNVSNEDTFSSRLEKKLTKAKSNYETHQVINTGVQGYSTYQELQILKESLRFSPDLIVIGFCMNDVIEPLWVNKKLGGVGWDYHRVLQMNTWLGMYLLNETGIGRLAQSLAKKPEAQKLALKLRKKEVASLEKMASIPVDSPETKEGWKLVFNSLREIATIATKQKIPVLLVIFPHTFQINEKKYQYPQRALKTFGKKMEIDVLDMTEVFENMIRSQPNPSQKFSGKEPKIDEIKRLKNLSEFFFDRVHYNEKGHEVVADEIFKYVKSRNRPL